MNRNHLRGILVLVSVILVMVGTPASASYPDYWGDPVDPDLVMPPEPEAWARPVAELIEAGSVFPSVATTNPLQPNCRFGLNGWGPQWSDFDVIENFGTGVYFNYSPGGNGAAMAGAEHIGLVMVTQPRPDDPPGNIENPLLPQHCDGTYTDYEFSPPLTDGPGGLGGIIASERGKLWLLGNEPERRSEVHTDICPQQYADAYHDFYYFVKSRDATAQVGVAGLVQVSPGRLQYRDIIWNTYIEHYGSAMPVDVWNMHIYQLSEQSNGDAHIAVGTDPSLAIRFSSTCGNPSTLCSAEHDNVARFSAQVVAMRRWMNEHGQRNKPLILSEFGINFPYHYGGTCTDLVCPDNPPDPYYCYCDTYGETFHPQRVADYLLGTMNYLLAAVDPNLGYPADNNRLVQQWLWFSLEYDAAGAAANLVRTVGDSYVLTAPGSAYHDLVSQIPLQVNLLPVSVSSTNRSSTDGTSPVTGTLSVEIRNNGTKSLTETVLVTFYADAALTVPIGSATVAGLGGCARPNVVVQVAWPDRVTGLHPFWVVVDSQNVVHEASEADNVMSGVFIANPSLTYLPLTRH